MLKTVTSFVLESEKQNSPASYFDPLTAFTFCHELESPLQDSVEVTKSYFDAQRIRSKRVRGVYYKTIAFGVLKRLDKVYAEVVSDCSTATVQTKLNNAEFLLQSSGQSYSSFEIFAILLHSGNSLVSPID